VRVVRRQACLVVVAIQFLTRIPVPPLPGYQAAWVSQSARYFPLVGVLVGLVNVAVWWLATRVLPPAVSIGVMLAASLLVTGAFHEDGFADFCDGFGGGIAKDRILEIMKDSRIGAYGAMGLFMMLALKWTTLAALPGATLPLLMVSAHMVSRWSATALIWRLPYVRVDDAAKAKPFDGSLRGSDWLASGIIGALAIACVAWLGDLVPDAAALALVSGSAAAALTAAIAAAYCRRRIGGYTGDCLGAVQQLTELCFLLAALAAAGVP
jgi:adenosylcobinamide-GDP ribazoletransferase